MNSARKPAPIVLMYHGLDPGDGRYDGAPPEGRAYVIGRETFREHLRALVDAGRRIVDPAEALSNRGDLLLGAGDVVLTFDDGDRSDYDAALPLLMETGVRALFFVATGVVGRSGKTDWPQWREILDAGMSVGSHAHSHQLLTSLSPDACRRDLETAHSLLKEKLGIEAATLSCPGGRFNRETLRQARACGHEVVFTSSPHAPRQSEGVGLVGRVAVRCDWTAERMREFLANQESRLRRMRQADRLRRLAQTCLGETLYERLHRFVWRRRSGGPHS